MRGYTQAQLEPAEAVDAMASQVPGLDRDALNGTGQAIPTWTAGAPYFGELLGPARARPVEGHRRPPRELPADYCERMRRNSWRTDSGRPHI